MPILHANLLLLLAAAFWGFGNVAQKTVLDYLDPMSAVGLRCLIGGLLLASLACRVGGAGRGPGYVLSLGRVAAPFALALVLQQVAYLGTSVTNASFLINTATVLTPLAAWAMLGERPTRAVLFAGLATLLGAALLSGGFNAEMVAGDLAAVAAAAGFALWMVELSRHLRKHGDTFAVAAAQFLLTAAVSLPLGALSGKLSVDAATAAWKELLMLGVVSTAVAFGLQTLALRVTPSSHAAVIISAEAVFGAAAAALLLGERLAGPQALGCILVLGAILVLGVLGGDRLEAREAGAS